MKAEVSAVSRLRIGIDGEGVTTLVAFMLCPLECRFCLNPQTLSLDYPYEEFTPESLWEESRFSGMGSYGSSGKSVVQDGG